MQKQNLIFSIWIIFLILFETCQQLERFFCKVKILDNSISLSYTEIKKFYFVLLEN